MEKIINRRRGKRLLLTQSKKCLWCFFRKFSAELSPSAGKSTLFHIFSRSRAAPKENTSEKQTEGKAFFARLLLMRPIRTRKSKGVSWYYKYKRVYFSLSLKLLFFRFAFRGVLFDVSKVGKIFATRDIMRSRGATIMKRVNFIARNSAWDVELNYI